MDDLGGMGRRWVFRECPVMRTGALFDRRNRLPLVSPRGRPKRPIRDFIQLELLLGSLRAHPDCKLPSRVPLEEVFSEGDSPTARSLIERNLTTHRFHSIIAVLARPWRQPVGDSYAVVDRLPILE
jgi:hypothetical protein